MNKRLKNKAFTLIELLVVISIIAALVAILSVAQRKVKLVSQNLRQKAAFHAGEISLELYSKDFGGYPDSSLVTDGSTYVTGSQRLAEAFFGRDDRGFNPKTRWHPQLDINPPGTLSPQPDLYDATVTLKDRKPPYFERKRVGFYSIYDLWGTNAGTSQIYNAGAPSASFGDNKTMVSPVFTDVFERNRVTIIDASGNEKTEKVGMPILYFKADPSKKFRVDSSNNPVTVGNTDIPVYEKWVYNFSDNLPLLQLPWLREIGTPSPPAGLTVHYKDPHDSTKSNAQYFYELITDRQDGNFYKPANPNTFLLISAGYDGIFGTKDDLTNFDY